jgi:hypothetical protein
MKTVDCREQRAEIRNQKAESRQSPESREQKADLE